MRSVWTALPSRATETMRWRSPACTRARTCRPSRSGRNGGARLTPGRKVVAAPVSRFRRCVRLPPASFSPAKRPQTRTSFPSGRRRAREVGRIGQDGRAHGLLLSRVGPEPHEHEAVLLVALHDEEASVWERLGPLDALEDEALVAAERRDAEDAERHVRHAVEKEARAVRGPLDAMHRASRVAPLRENGPVARRGVHDGDLREASHDREERDAASVRRAARREDARRSAHHERARPGRRGSVARLAAEPVPESRAAVTIARMPSAAARMRPARRPMGTVLPAGSASAAAAERRAGSKARPAGSRSRRGRPC